MKKIISIILLAVIISTSVLFTGCGGEVASNNAQTSDEADTTALSDTTPTADPNQFYDYKTNELISKSNKNNLNEKLMSFNDLVYMTSDNKVDSIDVEPSYVLLLSYLKDTSRDIWVLIYVKGDDVYVQADKRHANINLDTAGYDIYKSKRYLTYNNRYLYSVVALFFGIQLMLDASTLPAILNAKSMKPFADKVVSTVPNGEIYSYVESSMMRFFIINFYAQNRVIDFEKEMPKNGYLLVGERDFNYIKEKYGEQYTFEQTLRSDRKGNDVKDYILLFNFQENTAE